MLQKDLSRRWLHLWRRIGIHDHEAGLRENFAELVELYSKNRLCHGLEYIRRCLRELDSTLRGSGAKFCMNPVAVEVALFYLRAVYDTRAHNNEAESANLMLRHTADLPLADTFRQTVRSLILAVRHIPTLYLVDKDQQLAYDIHSAALALRSELQYEQYCRDLRKEFGWMPATQYVQWRAKVLRSLLERSSIFYTYRFRKRYEIIARRNISRELTRIGSV